MDKGKRLVRDILLFAVASFGSKVISFLLVPLYISCLPTDVFGTADLLNTIYTLLLPVLTLDIPEAILIYTIEYKDDREKADLPMQTGMWILGISAGVLLVCISPVCFLSDTENMPVFCGYIFIQYLNNALYNNYLAYLRGTDRVSIIVTSRINCQSYYLWCFGQYAS